jgi:hypothetical protein
MDVAEPLARVYLDIIIQLEEMVAQLHHSTPSCTLVASRLGWDPYPLCAVGLLPRFTSHGTAPLAPFALDVIRGSLYPHTYVHQRFIMAPFAPLQVTNTPFPGIAD